MKIRMSSDETNNVVVIDPDQMAVLLTSVFNGVTFMTTDNEALTVVMRDSGYELVYVAQGEQCHIRLNNGVMTCEGR
jgi:DNA-binding beta-propeller fold protein YncE